MDVARLNPHLRTFGRGSLGDEEGGTRRSERERQRSQRGEEDDGERDDVSGMSEGEGEAEGGGGWHEDQVNESWSGGEDQDLEDFNEDDLDGNVELNVERREERERRRRMARPPGPGDNVLLTPGPEEAGRGRSKDRRSEEEEIIIPPRLPNG